MNIVQEPVSSVNIIQYLIIALIGFIQISLLNRGLRNNSKKNAGFLTSLGIFGTFLGIAVGLWYFEPSDIDGSVKSLLGSMKSLYIISNGTWKLFMDELQN